MGGNNGNCDAQVPDFGPGQSRGANMLTGDCDRRRRAQRLAAAVVFAAFWGGLALGSLSATGSAQTNPLSSAQTVAGEVGAHPEQAGEQEHGLPRYAEEIARPFGFPITNSMAVSWVVALALILFAQLATRDMKLVPQGAQNVFEWLVESLYGFLEQIIGRHLVSRTFWFFATLFLFILAANWAGLIPGVGTIGWGHRTAAGFQIDQPLIRGANADMNLTFAMALVFFASWIVWALRESGVRGVLHELFGAKGDVTGVLRVLMVVVFFASGLLEVISILFRPVSLSFRLYGNIFAGETMLETMGRLVPGLGWLLPVPFYFLELLVGFVQAMVFMLLTAVFTLLICQHEEETSVSASE